MPLLNSTHAYLKNYKHLILLYGIELARRPADRHLGDAQEYLNRLGWWMLRIWEVRIPLWLATA